MKKLIVFLPLLIGCSFQPKYKVGDCLGYMPTQTVVKITKVGKHGYFIDTYYHWVNYLYQSYLPFSEENNYIALDCDMIGNKNANKTSK